MREDARSAAAQQELGRRADEPVDGKRRAGRVKRSKATEQIGLAKRPVRVHGHLTSEHHLVNPPGADLGQGGVHTTQEILVRSCRCKPEVVGRRGRRGRASAFHDRREASCKLGEEHLDARRSSDHQHKGSAVGGRHEGEFRNDKLAIGPTVERKCADRDRHRHSALGGRDGGDERKVRERASETGRVGQTTWQLEHRRGPEPENREPVALEDASRLESVRPKRD